LRAVLAKALIDWVVMVGPCRLTAPSARSVSARALVPDGLQFGDAVLQQQVGEIGDTILDGVVEPLELAIRLGRPLAQFGDMRCLAFGSVLPAVENPPTARGLTGWRGPGPLVKSRPMNSSFGACPVQIQG
jgi:hypothetical protein